jgi:hypothetical protein
MAGKKTNAKSSRVVGRSNGRHPKTSAASALAQAPIKRSERSEVSRSRHAQPSADELGLRAWQTTYRNSKGKEA